MAIHDSGGAGNLDYKQVVDGAYRLNEWGIQCCGRTERCLFRVQGHSRAYRCRAYDGYYTLLTGTVFEKTRRRLATLVLLRGSAKGEPTAPLAGKLY